MKTQTKEIIYEQTRDLLDLIVALNYGIKITEFNIEKGKEK